MAQKFPASDEFIVWAHSLSGMLTRIRSDFGTVAEMVEHPAWDEGKTRYALSLVKSLHNHLAQIDEELSTHVNEKYGGEHR
jgi:hypothetical protein